MSTQDCAIRTQGLRKVYKTHFWDRPYVGLEGLDLEVRRGEVFGFVGPNGAGKTTTIKILMGLQAATAGQAWILGRDHREQDSRQRVGFLPERPYFYQHLTAWELLDLYGALYGLDSATRRKRSGELLERVGLSHAADKHLKGYSKGMLQRAGVAQALLCDPELVVMDEPMSGLDPMGRALIRDIILEERAQGRTVFFSSHILADVEQLCDRVGIVVKGTLRGCGSLHELLGDSAREVDVVFQGPPQPQLPGVQVQSEGLRCVQRVEPAHLQHTLDLLRAADLPIVEVNPRRKHLEELLVDQVAQQAQEAQP